MFLEIVVAGRPMDLPKKIEPRGVLLEEIRYHYYVLVILQMFCKNWLVVLRITGGNYKSIIMWKEHSSMFHQLSASLNYDITVHTIKECCAKFDLNFPSPDIYQAFISGN